MRLGEEMLRGGGGGGGGGMGDKLRGIYTLYFSRRRVNVSKHSLLLVNMEACDSLEGCCQVNSSLLLLDCDLNPCCPAQAYKALQYPCNGLSNPR